MRLRRAWPAIGIWAVFLIFNIVMVASYSFFSGLFPSENALIYSGVFTALSIFLMSLITILLGRACERADLIKVTSGTLFKAMYSCLIVVIIAAGVWYRIDILAAQTGDVIGKYSLYENAMVGGVNITPEYDLLSILYSKILNLILFFTGNFISVPFFFQIACFAVFMICSYFTVKLLLGRTAAFIYISYICFMPVFTYKFTGLLLSTDSLFMAMFGLELLLVAIYLTGASLGTYISKLWIIWYVFLGAAVGFMAYVDAGTIIMILPFILSSLFLFGKKISQEAKRLLFIVPGAILCFILMLAQEQGFLKIGERFSNWAGYYFHNLNTFSMFWTYTDYKIIYLVTVVVMSGVIVGFWRNRRIEKVSPWLWSMIFIFATVPFMGATRMNTQVFVTVYYAFILGCVGSLTMMSSSEGMVGQSASESVATIEEAIAANEESDAAAGEAVAAGAEPALDVAMPEAAGEPAFGAEQPEEPAFRSAEPALEPAHEQDTEEPSIAYTYGSSEASPEPEISTTSPEASVFNSAQFTEPAKEHAPEPEHLFVPEGMVLPQDAEDADLTPRMKMPEFKAPVGSDGKVEKLKVGGYRQDSSADAESDVLEALKPADDFDIAFTPGDDFDI